MNTFNRAVVVLLLLITIPVCTAVLVVQIPILNTVSGWIADLSTMLEGVRWFIRLSIGIILGLIWLAFSVFLLILEFRRPKTKTVRLDKIDGGQVEVSLKTISDRVEHDINRLPGVMQARPQVSARRGGVVVKVDVDIAGDTAVPARASQIVEAVRRAVEEQVGIKMSKPPQVKVHATPATTSEAPPQISQTSQTPQFSQPTPSPPSEPTEPSQPPEAAQSYQPFEETESTEAEE